MHCPIYTSSVILFMLVFKVLIDIGKCFKCKLMNYMCIKYNTDLHSDRHFQHKFYMINKQVIFYDNILGLTIRLLNGMQIRRYCDNYYESVKLTLCYKRLRIHSLYGTMLLCVIHIVSCSYVFRSD
jgi:hypothetical protein